MPTASAITSFVKPPASDDVADIWARLTQEAIPSSADEADIKDLHQMISAAMAGQSAYEYVYDSCPYVVIVDGVVKITLVFFVWPSSLDLAYDLTATLGTISTGVAYEESRSFDAVFDHTADYDCEAVFDGEFTPEMPFFSDAGIEVEVDPSDIRVVGSKITLPEPLTTVLRAEGKVSGFRYELVIEIVKAVADPEGDAETPAVAQEVTEPKSEITVAWVDEHGETQSDIMAVKIPGCVIDLLATCEDKLKGDPQRPEDEEVPALYYSDCNGEKLLFRMEGPK